MLKIDVKGDQATVSGKVQTQADREKIVLTVGNTTGISKVDDRLELVVKKAEAPKEPEAKYYTVVKGDSLSKIAKAQYGDAMKYPVIFEANKPMLSDPDKILSRAGAADSACRLGLSRCGYGLATAPRSTKP